MKGDTVLDYAELQLTPPRTRCELFVSADGVTEKLASGFLKPFLTHLRAVEEQVARGCNSVRLEHPQSLNAYHGRSWFTKGTLERFVRFVSTPEVLERVKSVEDELAQLEQVRSIQASTLLQAENTFVGADSAPSKTDGEIYFGVSEKKGGSKLPRRYKYDAADSEAEASKVELLRAMDSRLLALHEEQTTAFGRAAAAGFSSENMADLIAFSEHFGAERLHSACINFLAVLRTRHGENTHLDSEAVSSGSGMLLCNVGGLSVNLYQGPQVDMQEISHYSQGETIGTGDIVTSSNEGTGFNSLNSKGSSGIEVRKRIGTGDIVTSSNEGTGVNSLSSKGSSGIEVRKRWGPPENIRTQLYVNQNETESASSNDTSNGVSVNGSPEVQSLMKKAPIASIEQEACHNDTVSAISATDSYISMSFAHGKDAANVMSAGYTDPSFMPSSEVQTDCNGSAFQRSLSPEKRLSLPPRVSETESSLPGRTFSSLQEPSIKEDGRAVAGGKDSKGNIKEDDVVGFQSLSSPVAAPARRLSVQDAISLFENKQRRDSIDSSRKQCPGKQESGRVSLEGAGISSSGSTTLKRRDSGKGFEVGVDVQENRVSSKREAGVLKNECLIDASASSLVGSNTFGSSDLSLGRKGDSLAQPLPGSLIKSLSNAKCQLSVPNVPATVEAVSGKQLVHQQEQVSSDSVREFLEVDWRKQFKLQLEKSLAKDSLTRDLPVKDSLTRDLPVKDERPKVESGISLPKKPLDVVKFDQLKFNTMGPLAIPALETRSKEALGKGGVSVESRQPLPLQGTAVLETLRVAYGEDTKGQNGLDKSELRLSSSKKMEAMDIKAKSGRNEVTKVLGMSDNNASQSSGRESLGSSSVTPLDHDVQPLATLTDSQTIKDPSGLKGRFYEHYRKLRDAKLMEDQDSKRAEREAKLKVMEETLTKRKAEMDARAVRLSKNSLNQIRATKVEDSKSDLHTPKKDQHDGGSEGIKSVGRDQTKTISSSTSPPLTPYASKEIASTSKPVGGRKAGAFVSQKGATPPRSSSRPTPSVSPKLTPRSTTIAAGSLRKSVASSTTDNPLTRSVPCFANMRKENTKPSPGRPVGSARVHPKNGGSGRTRGVNEAAPLEANVNVPTRTNFSRSGPAKEDQKHRSALMRKSCATASDFKTLSISSDDGVLAPLKGQREMKSEPAAYNKLRRSAIGPFQEAKPFLRKGHGIGPGTGPGMIKQKVSSGADTAKSSDEEVTASQVLEPNSHVLEGLDESNFREVSEVENMDIEDDAPSDFGSVNLMEAQVIDTVTPPHEDSEAAAVDTHTVEPSPDYLHDTERACHTISFPIDVETHNHYALEFGTETDSNLMFDPDALSSKEEDIETLSQHGEHTDESLQSQLDETLDSTSFHTSSLPDAHNLPVFSPVPPSPPSSNVDRHDQSSFSSAVKLESPLGSPASSQLQYTDVSQNNNKKWVAYQRTVMASQPKEPVRGFKRLLKFGRKSRASEIATADCISASTTSEGDDESEEQSRFFLDEVSSRGRLQEERYNDVLGEHFKAEEEGSAQNVRSSIPTPPANFRLRDDHLSGGTMLKAPRSFFSLSSFRSKGSEGKLR